MSFMLTLLSVAFMSRQARRSEESDVKFDHLAYLWTKPDPSCENQPMWESAQMWKPT